MKMSRVKLHGIFNPKSFLDEALNVRRSCAAAGIPFQWCMIRPGSLVTGVCNTCKGFLFESDDEVPCETVKAMCKGAHNLAEIAVDAINRKLPSKGICPSLRLLRVLQVSTQGRQVAVTFQVKEGRPPFIYTSDFLDERLTKLLPVS